MIDGWGRSDVNAAPSRVQKGSWQFTGLLQILVTSLSSENKNEIIETSGRK